MAYPRDAILAGVVAVIGGAALVLMPGQADQAQPPSPSPEDPVPIEPLVPVPTEPEPAPVQPEPEPEPEPDLPTDGDGVVFTYDDPGALTEFDFRTDEITPGFSGSGWAGTAQVASEFVYAPQMGWPLEGAGFANSQVFRPGGMLGGDQCDVYNYSYPWQDNFCETRSRSNGFCPFDRGHQGQDIRPAQCPRETAQAQHAVAAADGYISHIGSISVKLRDETGRTYWYLHLRHWESCDLSQLTTPDQCNSGQLASVCTASALNVEVGDTVSQGDVLGEVSDWFGIEWRGGQCRPSLTTDHLHFEIWDTFSPDGSQTATAVRVPPYSSLVTSYLRAIGADPTQIPDWDTLEED